MSLCMLIIANELMRFCFIVVRSHVFNLRIEENDLHEVAPIVKTNRMIELEITSRPSKKICL